MRQRKVNMGAYMAAVTLAAMGLPIAPYAGVPGTVGQDGRLHLELSRGVVRQAKQYRQHHTALKLKTTTGMNRATRRAMAFGRDPRAVARRNVTWRWISTR